MSECAPSIVEEYRLPEAADLTGDWAAHQDSWRAEADFNGDGREDLAILLPRRQGVGLKLVVLLSWATETPTAVVVLKADVAPDTMGLAVAPPGRYTTAVGKGYDFGPGSHDPPEIILTFPALNFFRFESASVFWRWDEKKERFQSIQMSD